MKKTIAALLMTGLMGTAFAQTATPPPAPAANPPPTIPGAKRAGSNADGYLQSFYIVGGVVVVAAIVAFSSGGGGNHATTGTTK